MSLSAGDSVSAGLQSMAGVAPIFIVGAPRSGTSLLRNLLNRHPNIALCDETYFFYYVYERRRAFGDLADPGARRRLVERYLALSRMRQLHVDRDALAQVLSRVGVSYPAFFGALIQFYAAVQGKRRCGEKTPQHALRADVLCDWFPDCHLIHLVRDPRDVVASLLRMPWGSGSVLANARAWQRHVVSAERCRSRPNYALVQYEQLIADPAMELQRICSALGEQYAPAMLVSDPTATAEHWWFARANEGVTGARKGLWREHLTAEQVSLVETVTGAEMRHLGYEPVGRPASRRARVIGHTALAFDAAGRRLGRLPQLWYHWVRPTELAAEEAWLDRRTHAPHIELEGRATAWRFSIRGVAVRLFLTCWVLYALHFATNTVREIYPALSLGDHLSFDVSEYLGFHPDIFALPGRGAFINNNPGASIVGAIPYTLTRPLIDRIVKRVQQSRVAAPDPDGAGYNSVYPMAREFYRKARERGFDVKFGLGAAVMQALGMAPLSAFGVVVMFYVLAACTRSVRAATALALLYAVATPIFYRTAQLSQNLLVAHAAFFAFVVLWQPWAEARNAVRPAYLLAGLLCGWAVVCDYSGLVVVMAIGAYAALRWRAQPVASRSRRDLFRFSGGVAIGGAVLLAYQWCCFGNPFYPAQHYMPPATYTHLGYFGIDRPRIDLLWDTAFSPRFGLFVSAPLLLLALYPPAWSERWRLMGRREVVCVAGFCLGFLIFCSANQYGRMQFNSGVRHVIPVSPFLFLIAAGVLLQLPRPLAVLIAVATAYWSWCLAMYRDVEQGRGVIESVIHISTQGVRLPWLTTFELMGYVRRGAYDLPLLVAFALAMWALWTFGAKVAPTAAGKGAA